MEEKQFLKNSIMHEVFVPRGKEHFVSPRGVESNWIFDFRRVLLKPKVLRAIAKLFLNNFKNVFPFQIGGIEVAAIPLLTGITMALFEAGYETNAFFIRKSRKKDGLLKMIEGNVTDDKIILVDDIINTGKSFIRQVEVAEALGKKIYAVFSILRFREEAYYSYFHDRGIKIISLFTLDDFKDSLNTSIFAFSNDKEDSPVSMPFKAEWYFKSEGPDFFHVIPKSQPILDDEQIYFGSDSGILWALNQTDGTVSWKRQVGFSPKSKHIFSSPALHNCLLYIGAYDGNFYALNTKDGSKKWMFAEADWIHSSPCVAEDLKLVVVGLEFGWWHKKGAIVAIDLESGKKEWDYRIDGYAYASPVYCAERQLILCGANNGMMYALDARRGKKIWDFKTGGDIKGRVATDHINDHVVFGSFDSNIYILRLSNGELLHKITVGGGMWSDPLIHGNRTYITCLDKNLYCIDLESGALVWKFYARARIFSSPIFIDEKIYFGSNDSRFYEIDAITGKETAFFQAVERITTTATYNPKTKRFFLPTFANEIYCLSKKDDVRTG